LKITTKQDCSGKFIAIDKDTYDSEISGNQITGYSSSKLYAVLDLIEKLVEYEVYDEKDIFNALNVKHEL
jgi:hypothetical protein